jgi:hypothetical protein
MIEMIEFIQKEINRREQEIQRLLDIKAMLLNDPKAPTTTTIQPILTPSKRGRKKKSDAIEQTMSMGNVVSSEPSAIPVKEKVKALKVKTKSPKRKKRKSPTTEGRIIATIKSENRLLDVNTLADMLAPKFPDKDYSTLTKYFNVVLSNLKKKDILHGVKFDEKDQKLSRNHWGLKKWFTEDFQITPEYYLNKD